MTRLEYRNQFTSYAGWTWAWGDIGRGDIGKTQAPLEPPAPGHVAWLGTSCSTTDLFRSGMAGPCAKCEVRCAVRPPFPWKLVGREVKIASSRGKRRWRRARRPAMAQGPAQSNQILGQLMMTPFECSNIRNSKPVIKTPARIARSFTRCSRSVFRCQKTPCAVHCRPASHCFRQ